MFPRTSPASGSASSCSSCRRRDIGTACCGEKRIEPTAVAAAVEAAADVDVAAAVVPEEGGAPRPLPEWPGRRR